MIGNCYKCSKLCLCFKSGYTLSYEGEGIVRIMNNDSNKLFLSHIFDEAKICKVCLDKAVLYFYRLVRGWKRAIDIVSLYDESVKLIYEPFSSEMCLTLCD